jgi:tetratricopeptide (TPR) repeat protein
VVSTQRIAEAAILDGNFERGLRILEHHLREHSKDLWASYLKCLAQTGLSDFEGAGKTCETMREIDSKSFEYHAAMGAVLTDNPVFHRDVIAIRRSIQHMKMAVANASPELMQDNTSRSTLFCNLANSQHNLFAYYRAPPDVKVQKALDAFSDAMASFNTALEVWSDNVEAWVNKGNMLDEAGRYVESLECYREAILRKPNHSMALGNRGLTLTMLAKYLPGERGKSCAVEGGYFLKAALMKREFKQRYDTDDQLKAWIDSFLILGDFENNHIVVPHLVKHLQETRSAPKNLQAIKSGNFRGAAGELVHSLGLHLGFSDELLAKSEEPEDWIDLPSYLRESPLLGGRLRLFLDALFDRYRTARNLYVLAVARVRELDILSLPSRPGFPTYSMNGEMLKESAKNAVDLLDSVALCLAMLGDFHPKRVTFAGPNSVFRRTRILDHCHGSRYLFALACLSNDIARGEYVWLDGYRNASTHEYLLLYDGENPFPENLEIPKYHLAEVQEFSRQALRSLRIAKEAILYLILFIMELEGKLDAESGSPRRMA